MDIEKIKLNTLANKPSHTRNIKITPRLVDSIVEIGYELYNQYLSVLFIKKDHLIHPDHLKDIPEEVQVYDVIYELYKDDEILNQFNNSLSFFLGTDNILYENDLFYIDDNLIDYQIFNDIKEIIGIQNGYSPKESQEDFKPKNDRVKQLRAKQLENRKKIKELKKDLNSDSDTVTFTDLISILSSNANGINIFNVFELNMYQFNDQFKRMKMISDYEVSIQSLLHGADPKNIELKHWISRS